LLIFAIMINEVRQNVLAILNKNNYGYLTPADFNLFAKQAQLEIFENYFYDYDYTINKQNAMRSGDGYADILKGLEEVIDTFSSTSTLTQVSNNNYSAPSDYYLINKVIFNNIEVERVTQSKILYLTSSLLTAPSTSYPSYVLEGSTVTVYPVTITGANDISAQYIRYPLDPNWTYSTLSSGEAVFNSSAVGYQDFELPQSDMYNLIMKICEYAGVQIREAQVVQYAQTEEAQNKAEEK
jgi:hypothetical protein